VRSVRFLIDSLAYRGAARQLTLLATHLPRETFQVRVTVLGTATPWAEALRAAGVEVDLLGRRRPFDVLPFVALRRLLRSRADDVVHVWGATALRAVSLTGGSLPGRLLVSAALPPGWPPRLFDRWLIGNAGGVIAFGAAEAERYRRLGVPDARITVVAPAVAVPTEPEPAEFSAVPPGHRMLLGIGPIERHKGFREAVWAFDILRHLYTDVHFVLAGPGSDRLRVEQFARAIEATRDVHFTGPCADLAPLLQRCDAVLVPSLRGGGTCAALEAMAAGRPVVASRCQGLPEIVVDGETGFLVQPDDKAALARQTRFLLDDPSLRRRLGLAGRQRALEHFSVARLVSGVSHLYAVDKSLGK
jgi:glycosyltransferase involved in cell wall biosynthesis